MASELPTFSVSDFLASINQTLDYAYPLVEVEGEVSGFKVNQNKYVFFDLKDANGSIGCFMTVWQLRVLIEDGMKIIVRATPKLTAWGKFSLTVSTLRPSGEGSIKKSFELLVAKLEKEGLFGVDRKRPLPEIPAYIGVISSVQAAGYADFIEILNQRWGEVRVDVAHVQVQGEAAPDQMIRALKHFNGLDVPPEVIVIIRGGGSADDLAAFNDEMLAREIAGSRVPTLVGVGHETDTTLADMVADVRASTPSNAAYIVVPDRNEVVRDVTARLVSLVRRMESLTGGIEARVSERLYAALNRIERKHAEYDARLSRARQVLAAYNPQAVLSRGYAIVRGRHETGCELHIETYQTIITAEVTNVKAK